MSSTSSPSCSSGSSSNLAKYGSRNPIQRWLIKRFLRRVEALLAACSPSRVLEAGCGEGFALRWLQARRGCKVTGVDISRSALSVARWLDPSGVILAADIAQLPFRDNSWDMVLALEVLEHLDTPEAALQELDRVGNSHFILSVPQEPLFSLANLLRGKNLRRLGSDPGHVQHWGRRGFSRLVAARLDIIRSCASFPWQIVLARKRKAGR